MPTITPISERAAATIHIPGFVDFLAPDGAAVWATNVGRIEKLEIGSASPVASVAMPSPCGVPAVAFDSVWIANCQDASLYRVDLHSLSVSAIVPTGLADLKGELSVAAGAGSIWLLTDRSGVLSRVDPQTNQVIARISVAHHSYAAAFGFDSVWITNTGAPGVDENGAVQRIDPTSNQVVATIPVGPTPRFLAVGEGGVWTLNQGDGSVTRIDPLSNRVSATILVPGADGEGGDIATGAGRVWVRSTKTLLSAIDPSTNVVVEQFGPPAGSGAVRIADGRVWVTAHDIHTVWAIRP